MYSRKSWGGKIDPFIMVKFLKPDNIPATQDPIVSSVIFEWADRPLVGAPDPHDDTIVSAPCAGTTCGPPTLTPRDR